MSLFENMPIWIIPLVWIIMLMEGFIFVLSLAHSKYNRKMTIGELIIKVILCCILTFVVLIGILLLAGVLFEAGDKIEGKQGSHVLGPVFVISGGLILLASLIGVPRIVTEIKAKRWRSQHSDYCQLILLNGKKKAPKNMNMEVLSVDEMTMRKIKDCIYIAHKVLYLPPGEHKVELVIYETNEHRTGKLIISYEKRRVEIQQNFKPSTDYTCKMIGKKPEIVIESCVRLT